VVGGDGGSLSRGLKMQKIVDAHQHLWDLDLFHYAWLKDLPVLNQSFRMNDYCDATKGLAIEKSVHLEADVDEPFMVDETKHVLRLADRSDNPLEGVVACGRPESKDFKTYLERILGHPKLKGIRRILHTQPDDLGQSETFIENVNSLAGYGLSFDLCVLARQLPLAIRLVSRCPEVTFLLDHCGVPQVREKILDPWRANIHAIAKFPNIFCKISGLVAYADPHHWTAEDLRPYVDHAIECFGWDRVMFGSDWPVCTLSASYRQWVDALASLTRGAGEVNQKKLFQENAIRIYRLA
jgi:predicted TIM-barrel fold metal-dependent hydrolase